MPLIEVHVIENVFNAEQKRQMITRLTDAMVSIEGEAMRGVTWVKISEVASGEWGIGGQALTTKPSRSSRPAERWPDEHRPCIVGGPVQPAVRYFLILIVHAAVSGARR